MAATRTVDRTINVASYAHGARIVEFSSECQGCGASNVLEPNPSKVWLTDPASTLPQYVVVQLKREPGVMLRTLGWFCWHAYSTNPARINLKLSRDGLLWTRWHSIEVECRAGIQLHKIRPFFPNETPFVKVEIVRSFGACQCYLNRLYLHEEEAADLKRFLGCPGCRGNNNKGKYQRASAGNKRSAGYPLGAGTARVSFGLPDLDVDAHQATSFSLSARRRRASTRNRGYQNLDLIGESLPTASLYSSRRSNGGRIVTSSNLGEGMQSNSGSAYQQSTAKKRDFTAELKALDPLIQSPIVGCLSKRSQRSRIAPRISKFQVPREEENMDACNIFGDCDESDRTGDRGGALSAVDLRTSYESSDTTAEEAKEGDRADSNEGSGDSQLTRSSADRRKLASWAAGGTVGIGGGPGDIERIQCQNVAKSAVTAESSPPSHSDVGSLNVYVDLVSGSMNKSSSATASPIPANQEAEVEGNKIPSEQRNEYTPGSAAWLSERKSGQLAAGSRGRTPIGGDNCAAGCSPGKSVDGNRGKEVAAQIDHFSAGALRQAIAHLHGKVRERHVLAARFELQQQIRLEAPDGEHQLM